MSCFEKIGNTISAKGREISQKAKAFSETSSLNNIIKAEQHKIDTNYKMMGKLYFEKYGDCASEEFSESINAVKASLQKISETQEQIAKIRSRNCCPNCGTAFKTDAVFCSKCGARVKEERPEPTVTKCENCGNKLEEDALFCDSCGAKVGGEVPLPCTEEKPAEPEKTEGTPVQAKTDELPQKVQTETVQVSQEVQAEIVTDAIAEEVPAEETEQGGIVKKCPSCGAEADDEQALFCNNCGAKL